MSYDDVAIEVRGLSKRYLMYSRPEDRLKQMVVPRIRRLAGLSPKSFFKPFSAIELADFSVPRGQTVGIIGRNGSGKSTLLQIICGTVPPSTGKVTVNGRIAALLELGAGFNPEFSGRENVEMNCAILGLSQRETRERFEAILQFADIGGFVEQPVKTYSSGMFMRLAFAVAINVDPDILIVDEALSVGDEAFQRKCFARIEQIKEQGATILFVSHSAQSIIQLCDRAILIDRGEILLDGPPKLVVSQYQRLLSAASTEFEQVRNEVKITEMRSDVAEQSATVSDKPNSALSNLPQDQSWFDPDLTSQSKVEYGDGSAEIFDLEITTLDLRRVNVLVAGGRYLFRYKVRYSCNAFNVAYGMLIKTTRGLEIGGTATSLSSKRVEEAESGDVAQVEMAFDCNLTPDAYFLNAGTGYRENSEWVVSHRILDAVMFRVSAHLSPSHSGIVDFKISPKVSLISEGQPPRVIFEETTNIHAGH